MEREAKLLGLDAPPASQKRPADAETPVGIMQLMMLSGLRLGEALELFWEHDGRLFVL
jgi:hypothetical protein